MPLTSVIVPCYRQAGFLPEALESVRAQTFTDWECLIVNDGSPDNTAQVARSWVERDPRFRYVEKQNGGLSSARNAGVRVATGEWLHFLDADDWIVPGMYQAVRDAVVADPQVVVVTTGHRQVRSGGEVAHVRPAGLETDDPFHRLLEGNPLPCHSVVARRQAVVEVGAFDESLRSCEDWDLWLKIAATGGRFTSVTGEYAWYRRYAGSMSTDHRRMLTTALRVMRRNRQAHDERCAACARCLARGEMVYRTYLWDVLLRPELDHLFATPLGWQMVPLRVAQVSFYDGWSGYWALRWWGGRLARGVRRRLRTLGSRLKRPSG